MQHRNWPATWAGLALLVALALPGNAQTDSPEARLAEAYYLEANYSLALPLYEKLFRQNSGSQELFERTLGCYLELEDYPGAERFVEWAVRRENKRLSYALALGTVWAAAGSPEKATEYWQSLTQTGALALPDYSVAGMFLYQAGEYELARENFLAARRVYKNDALFAADLANVYTALANYELATQEYLRLYYQQPENLNLAKAQILRLVDASSRRPIEKALLAATQKHPHDLGLLELLQDFYLQIQAYPEALLQARALDYKQGKNGYLLFQLAQVLQNNQQFELSNKALDYILADYKTSPYYLQAYLEKAKNFELKAFTQLPVDTAALRSAVGNYGELIARFGLREAFVEALYRRANLNIFYLDNLAQAREDLDAILRMSIPSTAKADAQLLIGDIHLLEGDYNAAKIAYLDIENRLKEGQLGAKAKYRLARLSYYQGNFEEAKARLGILKDNTSNDIANDAIHLYLVIVDNTGLDSTTAALEAFGRAELSFYQKKYALALARFDSLLFAYPNHPLTDDVYWQKATLYLQLGETQRALTALEVLLNQYPEGIYGDDALFKKAEVEQYLLQRPNEAARLYLQLLKEYPSSLYQAEARKRARKLGTSGGL